jgi:hypothetical protein
MAGSGSQWPNAAADPEALDHLAATAHTAAQQQQQDGAALHSGTPYGVAAAPLHCGSSTAHENLGGNSLPHGMLQQVHAMPN